jgi:hypothetical protein
MSMINYASREINCKIVYYGPGPRRQNYEPGARVRQGAARHAREAHLARHGNRAHLFFDFLPVDLGTIRGFKTRFHLYTVPGRCTTTRAAN